METNFGRRRRFSLGIEEELQILDGDSFGLVSRIADMLAELPRPRREGRVKEELLQSFLELATGVADSVDTAVSELGDLRRRARDAADHSGSVIAAAGTHPFSRYEEQEVTPRQRYAEFMQAVRWLGERQVVFGLHVHVGLESGDTAVACSNALRTHLPELLALSANSPFWQGRETGLSSTRIKVFDGVLRSGLPPAFPSFAAYERVVDRGRRTNAFPDPTHIWWDIRPHPKLGTLEVRICDAQTRLADVGPIAALVQSLVATFADAVDRGAPPPVEDLTLIEESKWRAARDGLSATLIDLGTDEERPAVELIRALVERCEPAARRLGCAGTLAQVEALLERGCGADEQRRVHERVGGDLVGVARWLAAETIRDV
jgi:carboxylate-amine ligase